MKQRLHLYLLRGVNCGAMKTDYHRKKGALFGNTYTPSHANKNKQAQPQSLISAVVAAVQMVLCWCFTMGLRQQVVGMEPFLHQR
ncbi:hypothetical protein JOB18_016958 [Solea senegalensis]|uniref:Uncharacterized protein n=1 Tax=Solea senegalensis TaxID=28829 RepID=A0AAV6QNH7_SOLSE|nr:hypothetical protein JOB18_016958 [Solea senegalensis]